MAVGIDLGTTNSLVAAVIDGRPRCLPADVDNDPLLPSVVFYDKEGIAVVGKRARALATLHPTNTIASVKRFMGRSPQDPQTRKLGSYRFAAGGNVVRFELDGVPPVTPIEVSAEILRALKRRAESALYGKVEQAVITVPAYFDEAQRQATRDAGRLAGLEVLRLLNEPTAAALAYGLDKGSQGTFAVYDLGGGTFDISILQLVEGVFEVKATGGDSALGGDDFDRAIAERVLPAFGLFSPSPAEIAQVLAAARVAKEALTDASETELVIGSHRRRLFREELDEWGSPLVLRTAAVCGRALKDAGISPAQLDGVILVGGATRMPLVRRFVTQIFGQAPLTDLDPDQVVAMGAAIQADLLTRKDRQDEVLLLDVIPLSLGLETMGGVVEKLIPRNSTVPTTASQVFTTFAEGQTGIDIHVLQGERELVEDCRSLARFRLSGIPPMPPGMARVEVTFEVDADGLLSVSAREQSTGLSQSIEVKPTHGLTEDEIDQMLLDSIENAETDVRTRLVREQRVLAERTLADARKQLADNEDLLLPGERATIESALEQVRSAAEGTEPHRIREALHALDHITQPFAERIMNRAIRRALAGRSVEDLEE